MFILKQSNNTQIQLHKRNADQVLFFSCSQTNIIMFVLTLYPHISGIPHNSHDLEILSTQNTQDKQDRLDENVPLKLSQATICLHFCVVRCL